jgi:N-acyl-D-aspartate/D-glutamate deacylase
MDFDLTIRNGRISTDRETFFADIGVKDGVIARIAPVSREMILNYIAERVLGLPKSY